MLLKQLGIRSLEEFHSRYNIAPTTPVPAIRSAPEGGKEAVSLRWGLIPSWAKDASGGARLCNARAEGIAEKPAFRHAFRHKRCLVPASGFYEWQTLGRTKQPWYFSPRDELPFTLAGIWESWCGPDGSRIETVALITTAANPVVGRIHDRMPVILPREATDIWLDPDIRAPEPLLPLLQPFPAEKMSAWAVNPRVNSVASDDPECLEPAAAQPPPAGSPQLSLGLD